MAEPMRPIAHIEGGDCRCLRCGAFLLRPDEGASMLESRRRRCEQQAAEHQVLAASKDSQKRARPAVKRRFIVLCYVAIVC